VAEPILRNLKLVGVSSSFGGTFGKVGIMGEAELSGDLSCRKLQAMGTVEIKGNLSAEEWRLTGECQVSGEANAKRLRATGQVEVSGSARVETIRVSGLLRTLGNLEAETVSIRGGVEVDGLLNAEQVDIRMMGSSRAKEIGGGTVKLKRSRAAQFKAMFASPDPVAFTAGLIEGDVVVLEHTTADIVRGNQVTIGPGCRIGKVEYRKSLNSHPRSSIVEEVKL
jgi:cytoskeletal protein CcmA (bactofilin family)